MEQALNKRLAVGILAHVDAGKTTLSEGMLYRSGRIKKLGRVDHRDAFLDTDAQERERGITIFSKQAELDWKGMAVTLLDTPGHVDFSSETERTLQILDCAILVVSGADGVQGHTVTLWKLLRRYGVPVFLFVNKMDQPGIGRAALMDELRSRLDEGCVDFLREDRDEQLAMCGEEALASYLESGRVSDGEIRTLIAGRKLFPCLFGSALKLDGVDALLDTLLQYAPVREYPAEFGARVYKIARDTQGNRLTYLKITGGTLKVKDLLTGEHDGERWEEKVNQIRFYSGAKFRTADEANAGEVCAVTGLSQTRSGEGIGVERGASAPLLEPVFTYRLIPPKDCDPHTALQRLRVLEEEDPQLHVVWNAGLRELRVQLMGEVQLEILKRVLHDRFSMDVSFSEGGILYRETIADRVEGIGHYEPLRHYAEVHLILEPGERGSGVRFGTVVSEDLLDRNWQRLILTHIAEKTHLGVLTGSPITDIRITLAAGRAHLKHTEGGDFRQATYRAIRQGLMNAKSVLLEPWYDLRLEIPGDCVGRAMTDIQQMGGSFQPPEENGDGDITMLGAAPVSEARQYARPAPGYTRGRGRLFCSFRGYEPCRNAEQAIAEIGYDPERDLDNSPDSIFCAHGAGFPVKWNEVPQYMHLESTLHPSKPEETAASESTATKQARARPQDVFADDKELMAIFERTYGPIKRRDIEPTPHPPKRPVTPGSSAPASEKDSGGNASSGSGNTGTISAKGARSADSGPAYADEPEYLLVDGYNIIFAWDELSALAKVNLDAARGQLLDLLANYQGYRKCTLIAVFDAYRVPRGKAEVQKYGNLHVVFTKEAETADNYIERTTYAIGRHHKVRVATSDGLEQLIILGHGARRISARLFHDEVEQVLGQISEIIRRHNGQGQLKILEEAVLKAQEQKQQETK